MKKRIALAIAGVGLTMTACGGGGAFTHPGSPDRQQVPAEVGYNNPTRLAASMEIYFTNKQTDGSSASVQCVPDSLPHKFLCNVDWSDGSPSGTASVTVSPDGLSWVSADAREVH